MNTRPAIHESPRLRERGAATVVVLALLLVLAAFLAADQLVLRSLKRELHRVEQKQLQKYQPKGQTNAPPARTASRQR